MVAGSQHPGGKLDISIVQGNTFALPFQLLDTNGDNISLNGATVTGFLKKDIDDSGETSIAFTGSVVSDSQGKVTLTTTQTSALDEVSNDPCERATQCYVYEIIVLFSDGDKDTVLFGKAKVHPEIGA